MRRRPSNTWPADHEAYLLEMWGKVTAPAIGQALGRTAGAVRTKASNMGLRMSLPVTSRRCLCGCGEAFLSHLPPSVSRINPLHASKLS